MGGGGLIWSENVDCDKLKITTLQEQGDQRMW